MWRRWTVVVAAMAACSGGSQATSIPTAGSSSVSTATSVELSDVPPTHPDAFSTAPGDDGTRYALGSGRLPTVTPVDVELPGIPVWVVGVPAGETAVWWVALDTGSILEVRMTDGEASPPQPAAGLPAGAPPAVAVVGGSDISLVHTPQNWGSPLSHPIGVEGHGIVIEEDGRLRVESSSAVTHFDVDAPPDAQLLADGTTVLLVTGATSRYPHGALGDVVEGSSVTTFDVATSEPRLLFEVPAPAVIEGATPMWTDLTGDGDREVVVTLSDAGVGARLVAYDSSGHEVATGPAIGLGNRWRHQIAAAPFGPDGGLELAAVLTPHIGGVVEFYRLTGERLEIVATVPGFSSHQFASHNLDMALAADADGDGSVELVVPTDAYLELGGIRRTADGAEVAWRVPIGGRMTTNLGVVSPSGALSFAVGRSDGVLRIWP